MKKMKKVFALLLTMAMILTTLSACGGGTTSSPSASSSPAPNASAGNEETYLMKIACQHADTSVHSQAFTEAFIPLVEEYSGGRIKTEYYNNGVLGSESDVLAQLQMGDLMMGVLSEQSSILDPARLLIPSLPFLFESEEHWEKVVDGELGEELYSKLPENGVRILATTENGYRVVTNNVRPIYTAADMKGLKMRVSMNDMYIANFTALGCSCQGMNLAEAYSAMETGAVDGQDNAYNTIRTSNFHEVQKYLANTNHVLGSQYLAVSETWFQSLPAELQEAVQKAATEAAVWQRKTFRELSDADLQFLKDNGMEVTDVDIASFQEATKGVYDDFFADYPEAKELVEKIQALA